MRLVSAAVPQGQESTGKFCFTSGYAGGSANFLLPLIERRKSREVSLFEIILLARVPQGYPAKCRVQASDPEDTALATFCVATSSNPRAISQIEWR